MFNFIPTSILHRIERFIPLKSVAKIASQTTYININGKSFYAPMLENSFADIDVLIDFFRKLKDKTKGKVALDIGANIGLYSSAMLMAGFEHVHSFEPNNEIKDNIVSNLKNFDDTSYTFHDYGIASVTQTLKLSAPTYASKRKDKKFDRFNSGTKSIFGGGENAVECEFRSHNDITAFQNLKHCDVIKIDVEGAELEVIRAIYPIIKKFKPLIVLELNPSYADINKEVISILAKLGYKSIERVSDNKIFNIETGDSLFDGKDYIFSS